MSVTGLTISQLSGVWSTSSNVSVAPHPVMIPCRLVRSGWEFSGKQIGLKVALRMIPNDYITDLMWGYSSQETGSTNSSKAMS